MLVRVRPEFRPERREYALRCPFDRTFIQVMKSFPGAYWDGFGGTWRVPEDLLKVTVDKLRRHEFEVVNHDATPLDPPPERPPRPNGGALPNPNHPVLKKLRPYQREGVEFVLERSAAWRAAHPAPWRAAGPRPDGAILWWAMGLGKGLGAVAIASQLPGPYLVIIPGLIRAVWAGRRTKTGYVGGEIRKWLGPDTDVRVLRGLDPFVARRLAIAAKNLVEAGAHEAGWVQHAQLRAKVGLATDDMADVVEECRARGVLESRKDGRRLLYRLTPGVDGETVTSRIRPAIVRDVTPETWLVASYEILDFRTDRAEEFVDSAGRSRRRYFDPPWFDLLCELAPSVVIADEVHMFKRWRSNRSSAVRTLTDRVCPVLRLGLTGTLFHNRPEDMYAPLAWAMPEQGDAPPVFGKRWPFLVRYTDAHQEEYGWNTSGVLHPEELRARLVFHTHKRTKDEVMLDLPPKTRQIIAIEAGKGAEFLNKAVAKLGPNPDKMALRKVLADLGPLKAPTAMELALNTDEPCCVFTHRRSTAEDLYKALRKAMEKEGRKVFLATGDLPLQQREQLYDQFRTIPSSVLVATMEVVAVGIDLSVASVAIFVDMDYVPGKLLQVEDRLHRQGQRHPVTIYYIAVENSIDETITAMLVDKLNQFEEIVGLDVDAAGLKANLEREEDLLDALVARLAARVGD